MIADCGKMPGRRGGRKEREAGRRSSRRWQAKLDAQYYPAYSNYTGAIESCRQTLGPSLTYQNK
jgi:hypothetical protein